MANAAAKKAAQARAQASRTYLPVFLGINAVYILLLLGKTGLDSLLNVWSLAGVVSIWGLQYFSYGGILDNAANRNPNDKSLVGGSSLDLLGLTVVIQLGTVLWTPKVYWLLLVVPVWGGWTLYSTAFGGGPKSSSNNAAAASEPTKEDQALADKRQKRSERRRQKRA